MTQPVPVRYPPDHAYSPTCAMYVMDVQHPDGAQMNRAAGTALALPEHDLATCGAWELTVMSSSALLEVGETLTITLTRVMNPKAN